MKVDNATELRLHTLRNIAVIFIVGLKRKMGKNDIQNKLKKKSHRI